MRRLPTDIEVQCNFMCRMRERGKIVPGTLREGHNIFTNTGRDWIAHLAAWSTIGSPDIAFTQRRVRWMSVGQGSQPEVASVAVMSDAVLATPTDYLRPIQSAEFPTAQSVRFILEFPTTEISLPSNPSVEISEAGLFVDVFPVNPVIGVDDSPAGVLQTTLDPTTKFNPPVAYKTFGVVTKTQDFVFEIQWDFRF